MRIRQRPEMRELTDAAEIIGVIDPATREALFDVIAAGFVSRNVLAVDDAGNVTLAPKFVPVGPSEACMFGRIVAQHIINHDPRLQREELLVSIRARGHGNTFKAYLFYMDDGRVIGVPGICSDVGAAIAHARDYLEMNRTTVVRRAGEAKGAA